MIRFVIGEHAILIRLIGGFDKKPKMIVDKVKVAGFDNDVARFVSLSHDDELFYPIHELNKGNFNPYAFSENVDLEYLVPQVAGEYRAAIKLNNDLRVASNQDRLVQDDLEVIRRV